MIIMFSFLYTRHFCSGTVPFKWTRCESAFTSLKQQIWETRCSCHSTFNYLFDLRVMQVPRCRCGIITHNRRSRKTNLICISFTDVGWTKLFTIGYGSLNQCLEQSLFGWSFQLVTENQPLTRIFYQNDFNLPITIRRNHAVFDDYKVLHKNGSENVNDDCLSRAPVTVDSTL